MKFNKTQRRLKSQEKSVKQQFKTSISNLDDIPKDTESYAKMCPNYENTFNAINDTRPADIDVELLGLD